MAVVVQNAYKSYGNRVILQDVNIHINKGQIYGLLGPSGCGKTTFLSCIVGRRTLNSGKIFVLGQDANQVLRSKIGYMPQDVALTSEFTVKDAIFYFGRLADMPKRNIEERFRDLSELLNLPPEDRFLSQCSGGQQRRISFAASLVQNPELLILDEPTVGLDSLLRDKLWQYLVGISIKDSVAIIITTHYIDEARQCNIVGMLRNGKILCHNSPENLMEMYGKDSLEDVFLILSLKQENSQVYKNEDTNPVIANQHFQKAVELQNPDEKNTAFKFKRFHAQLDKNFKQLIRNWPGIILMLLLPIIQIILSLSVIGPDPMHLKVGIVNRETNFCNSSTGKFLGIIDNECTFEKLSCLFLSHIDHPMIDKIYYDDYGESLEAFNKGRLRALINLPWNFTKSFENRIKSTSDIELWDVNYGQIQVWIDNTDKVTYDILKKKLLLFYDQFSEVVLNNCRYNPGLMKNVRNYTIFETNEKAYTTSMAPGFIISIEFIFSLLITSLVIIKERFDGMWERSSIAGVTPLEMVFSHLIFENIIVIIYCAELLSVVFFWFGIELNGSIYTIAFLTIIQGMAGMILGLIISIVSNSYTMAFILTTGILYFLVFSTGFIWPLNGMPIWLQWISLALPSTIPMNSLKNVMIKGWVWNHPMVLNGVGVSLAWIALFCIVSIVLLKNKI